MEQPPAPPASGPTVPKLSTTVLLAMGAIGTIVLVAIFVMARDAEKDAIRRAQRKYIP